MATPSAGYRLQLRPAQVLALGFALLILVGSLLLTLPQASATGQSHGFINALFTATSAACVTGLVVVNTTTAWSTFGHVVIICLIQAGGLGIMTMATLVAFFIRRRISLRERVVLQEALGQDALAGVVRLTKRVILTTLAIEAVGAVILAIRFAFQYPLGQAIWFGLFHAISAFCNAGFDLLYSNLVNYVGDPVVILTISSLIIIGGLGFTVLHEVATLRRWSQFSLHAKLVLSVTATLLVGGTLGVLAFEATNPGTLGALDWGGKLLGAWFTSVTVRTAGFSSVVIPALTTPTLLLMILLMFIGASPVSTGGGIKTSTFGTIMASLRATVRGSDDIELFGRRLERRVVARAWAIFMIYAAGVLLATMLLLVTEGADLMTVLFEVVSAAGTVGLSIDFSPNLTTVGRLVISLVMFAGRVGPLTLAVALGQRRTSSNIHYPEEKILIG